MTIFKKALTGCVIVAGFGLAGITSAFTEAQQTHFDDPWNFQYVAPQSTPTNPDPYSQTNVEDITNWKYSADDPGCSTGNINPCVVHPSSGYVQGSSPATYALDPSFVITATSGTPSRVSSTSDGPQASNFTNRGVL